MISKTPETPKKMNADEKSVLDRIDQLPLSIIPLNSVTFKKAKLFKNAKLETIVEMYNDPVAGSLQILASDDLTEALGIEVNEASEHDKKVIQELAKLDSFDIYSMRNSLQRIGLDLEMSDEILQLSDEMKNALKEYSKAFTLPLIKEIYGVESDSIDDDLSALFKNPDKTVVRDNLMQLSENTGIPLQEIPTFIQNYSEVYQSVAYYRYTYDTISEEIERFDRWLNSVIQQNDASMTPQSRKTCLQVDYNMRYILISLKQRFELFQTSFETFWEDINAQSFTTLRNEVTSNYETIGHVLCAVVVKVGAWGEEFPFNDAGSPNKRIKFTMTDLAPGIEKVRQTEEFARARLDMPELKL